MLHVAFAEVFDDGIEIGRQLLAGPGGDDNFPGTGEGHQPRGEIHVMAENIVAPDQDLAAFDPHAQPDLPVRRHRLRRLPAQLLNAKGRLDSCAGVVEFQEHAVAQALDVAALAGGQHVIADALNQAEPLPDAVLLVLLHKADGLDNVDDEHSLVGPPNKPGQGVQIVGAKGSLQPSPYGSLALKIREQKPDGTFSHLFVS
jgi:hypothetical protein